MAAVGGMNVRSRGGELRGPIISWWGMGQNHLTSRQNKADIGGIPGDVPDIVEAVPLGAAILAGTGIYQGEDDVFAQVHRAGRAY